MAPLTLYCFVSLLSICYSESNNAGASSYHGRTNAWSDITLIPSNATWTHFVYMIADNNLDYFGVSDLEEMRLNTVSTDDLNLVVYIDRCTGCDGTQYQEYVNYIMDCNTNTSISGYFNGTKILQKNEQIWCQIYDFEHELDSMQTDTISNFTALLKQFQLTSTYFMLSFWDHGGAWQGFGSDDHTSNASQDSAVNNLDGLFKAIQTGLQGTYLGRLDILGFDACIMADYSILHYISTYSITKYYVASEVSEPGVGWDYLGINASGTDPIKYAKAIINSYVDQGDVQSADAGAGYTLALFDMDKIEKFLNEFDSFIRMVTWAIHLYDYGMLMAILRGQSATISAEKDFQIYDVGLFLDGVINDDNIFWNTCNNRLTMTGENVKQYLNQSIIYFDADFVRKDMTGSTIFYGTGFDALNQFDYFNDDLSSNNYIRFLVAMNQSLEYIKNSGGSTDVLSSSSCNAPTPQNLSFYISRKPEVQYSSDYGLYKLFVDVTPTVMDAETYVFYENDSILVAVAELSTNIVDKDFDTTQLVTYWDGKIGFFFNTLNDTTLNMNLSEAVYSTGQISFTSGNNINDVPYGYIVKYPFNIYDSIDDNETNTGYLQFEVILGRNNVNDNFTVKSLSDAQLFEIDDGVISQITKSNTKMIEGLATVHIGNISVIQATGILMWPNFTIVFVPFHGSSIHIIGDDVFGNTDELMFNIMDVNVSLWNVSTTTTTTTTPSTSISSTSKTRESTDSASSNSGLDIVPSFVWLIILIVLIVVLIVFIGLWAKERKTSGLIIEQEYYVQMS